MHPDLKFLPDGKVICQICCEATLRDDLEPVEDEPGQVWDICKTCAAKERLIKQTQWCQVAQSHTAHGVCLGWPRAS